MLDKAFETIPDGTGLILHSDQGWQYQHKHYQRMLREKGIRQSMSRKGNCLDHTGITSFSGSFKRDLLYLKGLAGWNFPYELVGDPGHYNSRCIKAKRRLAACPSQAASPSAYLDKMDLMLWSNGSWYFGRLPRFVLFHFDFPIFRLNLG